MNATILMTYRESSPERHQNLLTTARWLAAEAPQTQLLVMEQDSYPHLLAPLPHPHHKILFHYNPHGFNKAWGLNVAARLARTPVLVFTDADVIVPGRLRGMVESCEKQYAIAKPHEDLLDLTEAESEQFHQGHYSALASTPSPQRTRKAAGEHLPLCGGMFAIRADAFFHVGGWDERFVGWGGEDDALSVKLQRAHVQAAVQPGAALHLWHPRATDQLDQAQYQRNLATLQSIRACSDAQLTRLAEVQRQSCGYAEKYRPLESAQ